MTIFEIDHQHRILHSPLVRAGCGGPSSSTWASWRSICGIPPNRRSLTCREAFLLMTMSKFTRRAIKTRVDAYQHSEILLRAQPSAAIALSTLAGSAEIPGKDVRRILELVTGLRRSVRTIRRCAAAIGVPFSLMAGMSPKNLTKLARAIATKSNKRATA